jgi:hypothetical protein
MTQAASFTRSAEFEWPLASSNEPILGTDGESKNRFSGGIVKAAFKIQKQGCASERITVSDFCPIAVE